MTSALSSHYYISHLHNNTNNASYNRKRIVLKRSTIQINDPVVVQQKYNYNTKPKKSVRFHDEQLEQVRYFYKTQSPDAVKEDPPLMNTTVDDYKLLQPNWPSRNSLFYNSDTKIRMESVQLADGSCEQMAENKHVIQGRCRAFNLSFHKLVSIRYTFDLWRSYEETTGVFRESIPSTSNTWDRFDFSIPFEAKNTCQTLYLALRYTVDNQEFWDNNNGLNYEIIISPNHEHQDTTTDIKEEEEEEDRKEREEKEKSIQKDNIKVLGKRYDFTASLSAARKPFSPPPSPPGTPEDTDLFNYTPPVFFSTVSTPVTPKKPEMTTATTAYPLIKSNHLSYSSVTEPIPIISSSSTPTTTTMNSSPTMGTEGFQMSYSDFINKYCFYNSHTNPMYNIYSTSPSAVIS
ncbi:putative phosphatase regulatory subunit-domain-containing protein [Cokeromyces recurvatus]|uniref:putative phosphatase regulatory subunit-domain-containing protein n=1 Tax=Cokeromyces recurvatus TaxID=90255 RepID=UPI0022201CBB|nr:putative phosphatase regulatory subunit-domain-containing protein [Cokeromyces recurvatus]KAI7899622.1 putative phosphatase regulatory subunit-domain-containing protein [Cokeromyces recurvatus]